MMDRRVILFLFLILLFRVGSAQKSDYIFSQYTVNEGLPSNECHDVVQDSRGFIWVATDNGVARFDGTQFFQYGMEEGLGSLVIFDLEEDRLGRIWAGGYENELYIYDYSIDRFESYTYNDVLNKFDKKNISFAKDFYFTKENDLVIPLYNSGLLTINEYGEYSLDSICVNGEYVIYDRIEVAHLVRNDFYVNLNSSEFYIQVLEDDQDCYSSEVRGLSWHGDVSSQNDNVLKIKERIIGNIGENIFEIEDDRIIWSRREEAINRVQNNSQGEVVLSFDKNKGVRIYKNLKNDIYTTLFVDISASGFIEDDKNGYWVTSLDKGLFYIKNTDITYLPSLQKSKMYTHLVQNGRGSLYTATFDGFVEKFNLSTEYVDHIIYDQGVNLSEMVYDTFRNCLWVSNYVDILVFDDNYESQKIESTNKHDYNRRLGANNILITEDTVYVARNRRTILKFDGHERKVFVPLDEALPITKIQSIHKGSYSDLILGTDTGLLCYKGDQSIEKCFDDSIFQYRFDKIIESKKKDLYLASKNGGLIVKPHSGDPFSITKKDGLLSNQLEDITFGEDESMIWVATLNGISKIEFYFDSYKIFNYTKYHGLPVPDVYDMEWYDDKLYAATGKGVIKLSERQVEEYSKIPSLIAFEVNGKKYKTSINTELDYTQKNIYLKYSSINYKLGQDQNFRYRINEGEWISTNKKEFYLLNLEPNRFKVEFQSQNEDGFWSASHIVKFSINSAWYSKWWFFTILFLVGAVSLTYHFLRREKRLKKENQIQEEIRSLEKAALQSQMNPHFIFNCLNSIQRFIMDNDKLSAMDYLSRFAKLIRLTLNASAEKEITVREEVKMLDYYLSLEKLRFKNKFNYEILVDNDINMDESYLSPLLIQPLVENAIKHGVSSIDYGGIVMVHFEKDGDRLAVCVKDNGTGFDNNGILRSQNVEGHKSFGMKITGDRLGISDGIKVNRSHGWTEVRVII